MEDEEIVEMETDELAVASGPIPFQLQLDKPIPFQIKIAEWNPEKDLLAMVTDDSKVLLHRFNWQRLWMITPGKLITSLCWRPDGRAIALGLEDGSILLHDVENGKLLRSIKPHNVAVICLNWEDYAEDATGENDYGLVYEDRTRRFFPPAPRIPRMPGLSSGDSGFMDDGDDGHGELYTLHQGFNLLCSGDRDGFICFNIFGIFPIGKINIQRLSLHLRFPDNHASYKLSNASIQKLALSKNLCKLVVLSYGDLFDDVKDKIAEHAELQKSSSTGDSSAGLHSLLLDTSIFLKRKNELHQVAQQASSIDELIEVIRASLSVMSKQWSDAMNSFHEKFDSLSSLIVDHGLDSSSQDEFLSLLYGARTSPPLHQFLVNSLGEAGLKRVSKTIDNAGKELHSVIHEHLQPAAEIIGFRIGELRGLSRWRARYATIGLDERLIDGATEKAGMLLVQIERFSRILAIVLYEFQNFFNWVLKCIKVLLSEPTDQLQPANSELVVVFLKFLLDRDPVGQLLEVNHKVDVDLGTMQRVEELLMFGGFPDAKYLERTLANEFIQMEQCLKEVFLMPFTAVSDKLNCEDFLPLYPLPSSIIFATLNSPMSVSYYKGGFDVAPQCCKSACNLVDYVCFKIPDESLDCASCICIVRGFTDGLNSLQKKIDSTEIVLLRVPDPYQCVDLSLYKDGQIALLLNEVNSKSESPKSSLLMMIQTNDLNFLSLSSLVLSNLWKLQALKASITEMHLENGKVRTIQDSVTCPLAVSASRGLACVFSTRRHALVYILDEDEDIGSDSD